MSVSPSLLRKYNIPGPRYTSYPTVPYWAETPTEAQWIEGIARSLDESEKQGIGAALYLHIPFCESLCTYCGCNTRITRSYGMAKQYVASVLKEWDLYLSKMGRKSGGAQGSVTVGEIHLGGGTPTFLHPDDLNELIQGIVSQVRVADLAEFSVEADPRVTQREHLEVLAKNGFKRLSLGIQDFDPRVQEIVHRVQSEEQVCEVTEMARALGFTSINYDLIYGLPLQTPQSVENTVRAIQRLRPDRIAFYGYAHVPWIKAGQRRFTEADLPSGEAKRTLYELGRRMLEDVGYHEVGMDHFALESDSLWEANQKQTLHRNFMGYTSRQVSPLIGLGVSSIGDSWGSFVQNEKRIEIYQERVENGEIPISRGHLLTDEDRVLRRHILNLMTRMGTDWSAADLQTEHLASVEARLQELESDGLVKLTATACQVTETGRPFLRNICMAFDARLIDRAPATLLFSQTI